MTRNKTLTAILASSLGLAATAQAATIAWTGGDITGDANVSTNGSLVFAINGNTGSATINTVNTVPFESSTRAGATAAALAQSGSETISTTINNDHNDAFARAGLGGVDTIGELIVGGWWGAPSGNLASITLSGLNVNEIYEIQLFTNDARGSRSNVFEMTLTNGVTADEAFRLQLNNSPDNTDTGANEAGDWAIGTFVADSASQSFDLAGFNPGANGGRIQVNAIQLRSLGVVPEPSSALLALIGLGFGLRRRR